MKKFFLFCFFWFNFSYSVDDPGFSKKEYEKLKKDRDDRMKKDLADSRKLVLEVSNELLGKIYSDKNGNSIEDEKSFIESNRETLQKSLSPFLESFIKSYYYSEKFQNHHHSMIIQDKDDEINFYKKEMAYKNETIARLEGEVIKVKREKEIEGHLLKSDLAYSRSETAELKRKAWSDRILVFPAVNFSLYRFSL